MTSTPHTFSRRHWLGSMAGMGLLPVGAGLGLNLATLGSAAAATGGGYKALVCVFLTGGNDAINTVLSTDANTWSRYDSVRGGTAGIALAAPGTPANPNGVNFHDRLGGALSVTTTGGQGLAFHPVMGAVRDLFSARRLAVVANVGPLLGPLTKTAYQSGVAKLPAKLFSHNDQQSTWQSFSVEGATEGWGGRMTELFQAGNARSMFAAMSLNGAAVWINGHQTRGYQMSASGPVRIGGAGGKIYGSPVVQQKLQSVMRTARQDSVLMREHAAVSARALDAEAVLAGGLPSSGPWATAGTTPATDPLLQCLDPETGKNGLNPLAWQLQTVARNIAARDTLGMTRQVFFVSMGGFDTHDNQPIAHAKVLAKLSHALAYFDQTLKTMGVDQSVTTFTASDFGRTFTSNGDGSDHGWGGHHLVMGGAVAGGQCYGRMPTLALSDGRGGYDSPDLLNAGVLLPSTSVDQYAATLGRWLGVSDAELLGILPGLSSWSSGARNLGFV